MASAQKLPQPISSFFAAVNSHDASGVKATTSKEIHLVDESGEFLGTAALLDWFQTALVERNASIHLESFLTDGDRTTVALLMDGDFTAGYGITKPFVLWWKFTLAENLIQELHITDIGPDIPTMRAVFASRSSTEDPLSVIRIDVRPVPVVRKGWVRIKVATAGLNYRDIYECMGISMHPLRYPLILGMEASGTLDDGTEVLIYPVLGPLSQAEYFLPEDPTIHPQRSVVSELIQGALAEYVVVPKENIIVKPSSLSHKSASVLGVAWLTAFRMIFTRSELRNGDTMLVQGSAGGVATALIQIGAAAGYNVWATGRTENKRSLAMKLGASRTFAPGERVPEKVAAVFNFSGGDSFGYAMESVVDGGTIVICGSHSGLRVEVELLQIHVRQIRIVGNYLGRKQDLENLVSFVVEKGIEPHISEVLPIERVMEGLAQLKDGEAMGQIVIQVS